MRMRFTTRKGFLRAWLGLNAGGRARQKQYNIWRSKLGGALNGKRSFPLESLEWRVRGVGERSWEPLQKTPHSYTNLPKGSSDSNPLNKGDIHLLDLAGSVLSCDLVQHSKFVREPGRARHHG